MKEEVYLRLIKKHPGTEHLFEVFHVNGKKFYRYKVNFKLADRDLSEVNENLKKTWLALGESSFKSYNQKGFVDGVPISAHNVSVTMKGKQFKKTDLDIALDRLKEKLKALKVISQVPRQRVQQET